MRGHEMRAILAGLALILLCGCMRTITVREPVEVTKYVYVRIDPALTAPCPVAKPRNRGVGESLRVNRERRKVLEDCDARMSKIRAIEGTLKP
jgi:hypothetical protein